MAARRRGKVVPDGQLEVAPEVGTGPATARDPVDPVATASVVAAVTERGSGDLAQTIKLVGAWQGKRAVETDQNFGNDAANAAIRDMNHYLTTQVRTRRGDRSPGSAKAMADYIDERSKGAMEGLNERAGQVF
jgi:hypothetical protein